MFNKTLKPNKTERQSFWKRTVLAGISVAVVVAVFLGLVSAIPSVQASAGWAAGKFGNLLAIPDNYQKIVVSMDKMIGGNYKGVKHRQIVDFLLDDKILET